MNLLKAEARSSQNWWEIRLLELDVVADGATEQEMLSNLRHNLIAQYYLDLKRGKTPFVSIAHTSEKKSTCPEEEDTTRFRDLGLPDEVRKALAAVLRKPTTNDFKVNLPRAAA